MAIDTIVFDLGGVLVDWNPRYVYYDMFPTEAEAEDFLQSICTPAWNAEQDRGRSLQEATEALVAIHPKWTQEILAYYGRWHEMLRDPIHESVELLQSLKHSGDYRLLALTNWSAETFPVARERFDFLQWFEGIVVSGEEKLIKPDAQIYECLFARYQVTPERAVFIDDSAQNVETARQLGMQGIHFRSPMQLRESLAEIL
jgi:2-haloacid dehalogenase